MVSCDHSRRTTRERQTAVARENLSHVTNTAFAGNFVRQTDLHVPVKWNFLFLLAFVRADCSEALFAQSLEFFTLLLVKYYLSNNSDSSRNVPSTLT